MSSLPGRGRGHRAGGRSARLLFPMPQPVPADLPYPWGAAWHVVSAGSVMPGSGTGCRSVPVKHGVTEAKAIELTEAWKRAARKTKRLHLVDGRQ